MIKMRRDTLKQAVETYGAKAQLNTTIEKFADLIKEICKHTQYMDNTKAIIEKIADCYIMLEQMQIIFGLGSTVVFDVIDKKIKQLKSRLSESTTEKDKDE